METTGWKEASIKVIGVGGAGGNAVDRMIQVGIPGVEFIAANTDLQALARCEAPLKIALGGNLTRSLGAGGNPQVGAAAAQKSHQQIRAALEGADMVFVTAGMGGGTGTGAAPVIAEIARAANALTVAVVTEPFSFEGARRARVAAEGLARLGETVDAIISVPNDRLLQMVERHVSLDVAFRVADEVLRQAVQGISELITRPGLINLDFADIRSLLHQAGKVLISVGYGEGQNKAGEAVHTALDNPLLDARAIERAERMLVNITGGHDLTFLEVNQAMQAICRAVPAETEVLFGAVVDEQMKGRAEITLIVSGVKEARREKEPPAPPALELNDLTVPAFLRKHALSLEELSLG